jgi:electron transfer flavoprotein beta subunit
MLSLIVCAKQVLDPEAPSSAYKLDKEEKHILLSGVPPVINPFDENALEAALRIKECVPSRITVMSVGWNLSRAIFRKTLAAGADGVILIESETFHQMDSSATAAVLAAAIGRIERFDLVLAGRQAADTNNGVVPSARAEILGLPSITVASKVEIQSGIRVRAERVLADGCELVESSLPALVTISSELGGLRTVSMAQIMAAQKKPLTAWSAQDLGLQVPFARLNRLLKLSLPRPDSHCQLVGGETLEEKGRNLALKLKEMKII